MRPMDEKAVSEVIGVVLLISVTVLGVALVAVTFLSQSGPSEIPHASVMAGAKGTTFVLSHEGGDALVEGSYRIYVDAGMVLRQTDRFILRVGMSGRSVRLTYNYLFRTKTIRVIISAIDSGGETMITNLEYDLKGDSG